MLQEAIFPKTCLAILLRHKLHEKIAQCNIPPQRYFAQHFFAATVARRRNQFYFWQRISQCCNKFFNRCVV